MPTDYKDFQSLMASELSALSGPEAKSQASSRMIVLELSEFPSLPAGTKARLESVEVSKLESGDYILVNATLAPELRRFVGIQGSRLVVANGSRSKEQVPQERLLGRIAEVASRGKMVDPNPVGILQRASFRFLHR